MSLYKDLLKLGKDAIADIERPFKVKKEQKNLEMKILEFEQQIAKDELTIQEEKSKCPVDWDRVVSSINSLELNNRKLKQFQELEKEMFHED